MRSARNFVRPTFPSQRQRGQALIYGLFFIVTGLAALFFLFNTGQLSSEKTKLVNTADAVAYSAGVMHARALNFDAYTNRALMANEVMIAQMVSLSSWVQYAEGHVQAVPAMACYTQYSVPVGLALIEYIPLCYALSYVVGEVAVQAARQVVDVVAPVVVAASELAKVNLQLAQVTMFATFLPARANLMQQVADANYLNDGVVRVDTIPLTDNFVSFEGQPFIQRYSGDDRTRFREAELTAAHRDQFVRDRSWSSRSAWGCIPFIPSGRAERTGSTDLVGFDEWRAEDQAALQIQIYRIRLFGRSGCRTTASYDLGSATQSSDDWSYSGVPNFFDLSDRALAYTSGNPDPEKRDPRLKFAIRLVRSKTEARTSAGTSAIKPTGRLAVFDGAEAGNVMAAVGTSEVYFARPPRADGREESASLFNPYWQVRLTENSVADLALARGLQR